MMFLTQMHLNPARRGTRLLLASPQRMHAAVMLAFSPDVSERFDDKRVLWRVDTRRDRLTLYVSSPVEPDLTHVVEQAGWPASPEAAWRSVPTEALLARLAAGQEWVFRLTANPVRSRRGPSERRGKVYGHVTVEQQEEWLRSRSGGWGFDLVSSAVVERRQVTFSRRSEGLTRPVTLSVATFDGQLRVTDPVALGAALSNGVGRAKGYGCGLITLAPVR